MYTTLGIIFVVVSLFKKFILSFFCNYDSKEKSSYRSFLSLENPPTDKMLLTGPELDVNWEGEGCIRIFAFCPTIFLESYLIRTDFKRNSSGSTRGHEHTPNRRSCLGAVYRGRQSESVDDVSKRR